jgi:hypothetical protein
MALDFFAIASCGVYPTPTPTDSRRAALAVSMGLLNITLPSPTPVTEIFRFGKKQWGRLRWGVKQLWKGR